MKNSKVRSRARQGLRVQGWHLWGIDMLSRAKRCLLSRWPLLSLCPLSPSLTYNLNFHKCKTLTLTNILNNINTGVFKRATLSFGNGKSEDVEQSALESNLLCVHVHVHGQCTRIIRRCVPTLSPCNKPLLYCFNSLHKMHMSIMCC